MDERKTVPDLPLAPALAGTEDMLVWQDGKLVRTPGNALLDLVRGVGTPADLDTLKKIATAINNAANFHELVLRLAGGTMTGALTLFGDPASPLHAATKQYVDAVAQGLDPKQSVRIATLANIALTGTQTIDGVAVVAGDRVLVRAQTAPAQNGIYVVAAGAWTRAADMDAWAEVPGAYTFVEVGATQAESMWVCTSDAGGTLGTTAINWSQFGGGTKAAFSAHKNGVDQGGIVSATLTRVTFGTEDFDVGGFYAGSKWVPPAGKVRVSATVLFTNANMVDTSNMQLHIHKNGVSAAAQVTYTSGTNGQGLTVTRLLDVNGTDEIEVYALLAGAGNKTIDGGVGSTYFSGESV